jgi:hypothetical protein
VGRRESMPKLTSPDGERQRWTPSRDHPIR